MQNLADAVLNYFWFIEFSPDDELDPDRAVDLEERLIYAIENQWTDEERHALSQAAQRSLDWWLKEPDEHGYTPRKLLTADQKEFLENIIAGRFDGHPSDEDEDQ